MYIHISRDKILHRLHAKYDRNSEVKVRYDEWHEYNHNHFMQWKHDGVCHFIFIIDLVDLVFPKNM